MPAVWKINARLRNTLRTTKSALLTIGESQARALLMQLEVTNSLRGACKFKAGARITKRDPSAGPRFLFGIDSPGQLPTNAQTEFRAARSVNLIGLPLRKFAGCSGCGSGRAA